MEVIDHLESCPRPPEGCVVTVGNFDGVHLGHRAVIESLRSVASGIGHATAVVTFEPHTLETIRPELAPERLTTLGRKLELLAQTSLDYTMVLRFDNERAHQLAEDFVEEVLVGCLHTRVVMVGEDFRFGRGAKGDVALLEKLGTRFGFSVEPIQIVSGPRGAYSSTAIRKAVTQGKLEAVSESLARPYDIKGEVIHGDKRGRLLGFPTVNLLPGERMCRPPNGVYAGRVRLELPPPMADPTRESLPVGLWQDAIVNVGVRPTFRAQVQAQGREPTEAEDAWPMIEAHIFDFDADLYGATVDVAFVKLIRAERRFESSDALAAQIRRDVLAVRGILADT